MSKRRKGETVSKTLAVKREPARKRANIGLVEMDETEAVAPVILAPAPIPQAFGGIVPFLFFLKV